jgi:hypothetical protein
MSEQADFRKALEQSRAKGSAFINAADHHSKTNHWIEAIECR